MLSHHLRELSTIVVLLWLSVEIGTSVYGIENGDACGGGLIMHTNNAGQSWCCLKITCNPGTETQPCGRYNPDNTSCISCKPGTYQSDTFDSHQMRKCTAHARCDHDAVVIDPGSSTTNVRCACNLEKGYYGTWPDCIEGESCKLGYQLTLTGDCEECPPNSYKNSSNSGLCLPCSICDSESQEITSSCTAASDAICRNKTYGLNSDDVSSSSIAMIILSVVIFVVVIGLFMAIICHVRKRRTSSLHSSISGSSGGTSTSDPCIEQLQGNDAELKENLCRTCDTDQCLEHSSLCSMKTSRSSKPNYDFGHPRMRDSDQLLRSPSDNNVSSMDIALREEREENQQSIQYKVETGSSANNSQRSHSDPHATVMKGKINVQSGNVYNINNCQNITIRP